jgi:hypothetical protein
MLRLVPAPQLALVHLLEVADREVEVGDTAAKTPIPTAVMKHSEVQIQRLLCSSRDEKRQCKLHHTERKEAILSYFLRLLHEAQELSHIVGR